MPFLGQKTPQPGHLDANEVLDERGLWVDK